jgi:hypothetical protein
LEVVIRVGEVLIAELDGPWPSVFIVIVESVDSGCGAQLFTEHKLSTHASMSGLMLDLFIGSRRRVRQEDRISCLVVAWDALSICLAKRFQIIAP